MTISRRQFLQYSTVGTAFGLGLPISSGNSPLRRVTPANQSALRILVLGGTGFIGPHMVQYALDRGHSITLFNRGRTNTHLFPGVQKLVGDRNGHLDALRGGSWDIVVDNTGYVPGLVRDSAELLKDSVGHYFYTSTIDAYRDHHTPGIDESYPLATLPEGAPHNPGQYYGPLKAMCEEVVRDVYPNNHTIVRPGWIVGPGDNNHLFTYWPVRINRGGEVLAPGTPDDPMQVIDVRDLGTWVVDMLERSEAGSYNAVGPVMTMAEMLYGCRAVTSASVSFTWVDANFLWNQGLKGWTDFPIWWPPDNDYGEPTFGGIIGGTGTLNFNGALARSKGLQHRPFAETALDTLNWYGDTFDDWPEDNRPGVPAAREAQVLAAWRTQ